MNKPLSEFINLFLSFKDEKEIHDFLLGILTPKELIEIPMRLQIVKMLKKGVPQQEISEKLKVGLATITRGSKEIQKGRFKNIK